MNFLKRWRERRQEKATKDSYKRGVLWACEMIMVDDQPLDTVLLELKKGLWDEGNDVVLDAFDRGANWVIQKLTDCGYTQIPRHAVVSFSKVMEKKLTENDHKTHWSEVSTSRLLHMLEEEVVELKEAIDIHRLSGESANFMVIEECADVANFAMMIADNMSKVKTKIPEEYRCCECPKWAGEYYCPGVLGGLCMPEDNDG